MSTAAQRRGSEGQHQLSTSLGEEDSSILIEWLNAAKGSRSHCRVVQLISNIQTTEAAVSAAVRDNVYVHSGSSPVFPPEKVKRQIELSKLYKKIASALRHYVFRPRLTSVTFGRTPWWFDLCGDRVRDDHRVTRPDRRRIFEADAVFGVLRLASFGLLDRVRPCAVCQTWLYARPAHKKFCSKICQTKYFSSMPQHKKKRAAYMREYRRNQGEQSIRALQNVSSASHP